MSSVEAAWRLLGFDMQDRYPAVNRLNVHLPEQQSVVFNDNEPLQQVSQRTRVTKLTEYFATNRAHPSGLLYSDFPNRFTWKRNKWRPRRRQRAVVGRMYLTNAGEACPSYRKSTGVHEGSAAVNIFYACAGQGERHFLRMLLCAVKGATSFEHLRTVDGCICPTFKDAAIRKGLLEDDSEIDHTLTEAASFQSARSLREMFCMYLVHCPPQDAWALWQRHQSDLIEDFVHRERQVILLRLR